MLDRTYLLLILVSIPEKALWILLHFRARTKDIFISYDLPRLERVILCSLQQRNSFSIAGHVAKPFVEVKFQLLARFLYVTQSVRKRTLPFNRRTARTETLKMPDPMFINHQRRKRPNWTKPPSESMAGDFEIRVVIGELRRVCLPDFPRLRAILRSPPCDREGLHRQLALCQALHLQFENIVDVVVRIHVRNDNISTANGIIQGRIQSPPSCSRRIGYGPMAADIGQHIRDTIAIEVAEAQLAKWRA